MAAPSSPTTIDLLFLMEMVPTPILNTQSLSFFQKRLLKHPSLHTRSLENPSSSYGFSRKEKTPPGIEQEALVFFLLSSIWLHPNMILWATFFHPHWASPKKRPLKFIGNISR